MKINNFIHSISITFLILSVSSCSPTLRAKKIDSSPDQLPTSTRLKAKEILVRKNIRLSDYRQFLFVRTGSGGLTMNRYDNYILATLKNIGYFDKILTESDLQQLVIQKGIADRVSNISDNLGLFYLQKEIGKFLIAQTLFEQVSKYAYVFHLEIIDPANGETVYYVKHSGLNWSGLDRPLFNPVFNDFIVWVNQNS